MPRERFGWSDLPRFNRYAIQDNRPNVVECPHCAWKGVGVADHVRFKHPDRADGKQ